MHTFYTPDIGQANRFELPQNEAHHAIHVLRLKAFEKICLVDGKGNLYEAEIVEITKKNCSVKILSHKTEIKKWNFSLHIAIAPTKSSARFDFFMEKAAELGIDEISPVLCKNSERRKLNIEKERQTLIAAIKQSQKAILPVLNDPVSFETFILYSLKLNCKKYIAHCNGDEKFLFTDIYTSAGNSLILIGPEGDFTKTETDLAVKNNFIPVSLGAYRLRTETAGIFAVAMLHILNKIRC